MESHNVKCHQIRKVFDIQMVLSRRSIHALLVGTHILSHLGAINVILANMKQKQQQQQRHHRATSHIMEYILLSVCFTIPLLHRIFRHTTMQTVYAIS